MQHLSQQRIVAVARFLLAVFAFAATLVAQQSAPAAKTPGAYGKCTQELSGVDFPGPPHGLFVLLFPRARVNAKATASLLHVPELCGADVYVQWKRVDRGPDANPRYDWSSVDEQMAPWVKAGKQINLIVWATGYGARAN